MINKCFEHNIKKSTYSGAPAAQRTAKQSPIPIQERKENTQIHFLVIIVASGIEKRETARDRITIKAVNVGSTRDLINQKDIVKAINCTADTT